MITFNEHFKYLRLFVLKLQKKKTFCQKLVMCKNSFVYNCLVFYFFIDFLIIKKKNIGNFLILKYLKVSTRFNFIPKTISIFENQSIFTTLTKVRR